MKFHLTRGAAAPLRRGASVKLCAFFPAAGMTDMNTDEILKAAQARGKQLGLPYAGALKPTEAYALMQHHENATLVDVRTAAEWHWVGRVPDAVESSPRGVSVI